MARPPVLIRFNKPYGVLCQFRRHDTRATLADHVDVRDVYPCGRLDRDSEGLLLLTDSGPLQHRIAHPDMKLPKRYWVQVEHVPASAAIARLRGGLALRDGMTGPAKVTRIDEPDGIWPRDPPVRYRKSIPTAWLEMTIWEGRNRQVRRMCAAVGHPCLRLIRAAIGPVSLTGLAPGHWERIPATTIPAPGPRNNRRSRLPGP